MGAEQWARAQTSGRANLHMATRPTRPLGPPARSLAYLGAEYPYWPAHEQLLAGCAPKSRPGGWCARRPTCPASLAEIRSSRPLARSLGRPIELHSVQKLAATLGKWTNFLPNFTAQPPPGPIVCRASGQSWAAMGRLRLAAKKRAEKGNGRLGLVACRPPARVSLAARPPARLSACVPTDRLQVGK